ncbi:T9SS type A sorting domain-containing protein [Ferruginibacter yonginensis]|uniref:T9SS type A sorting domain-containing protein n=1 Tax=Ferruginibacter yonginensis TaxID=1310416 RepID=A0ABV8QVR1_9BACT
MSHFFCKQFFFLLSTLISSTFICNAQVSVNPGAGSYPTLTAAFAAINAGTHTGAVTVDIVGNTVEGATTAVLNASGSGAASYTSIVISPSGGARLITGTTTAGSPLIDLNGADNVTINGLNAGGNSLTIQNETVSATSGTCTIRFIGGATNNVITNCTINGAFTGSVVTNGGTIFFSTDGVTTNGNDNNTISNNNIGPVGTSLPTKAILGNGSTTTTAIGNSGILIDNNNIFDYFGVTVTSSGIATNGGCNTWSITNNRFYQTGTRTWTTGSTHRAIDINNTTATSGATGFTITGNTIGYASNTQTGTYTLTGSTGKFQAINFNGINGGSATNINNNTIASISLTGVTSSGTGSSSPFLGILVSNGVANTNNNTIGSQSTNSSLVFSTNTTAATDVIGIYNFSVDIANMVSNNIGAISVTNAAASGTFIIYGIRINTSTSVTATLTSNTIGGSLPNSIQLNATGASSQIIGIVTPNAPAIFTSNTIRNLTSNIGTGTTTAASVIGILVNSTTPNHTLSQNVIFNLTNTNATAATVVTGIQFTGGTANIVERNSIYDLTSATNSTTAEINGIRVAGGTTVYRNNMIRLGQGVINAIGGAATNSSTAGINGFNGALGTDQFIHNSVYIGGSPTAGVGSSFAFNGTQTTNTRTFRNNVFFNARSNNGATGKNYAIKINGTTANPAGLTLNNNNYFANETGGIFGFFNGADVANLAAWQAAVGQDANSLSVDPLFVSTTDLHLTATSTMIDAGVNLSVANDFDGDTRGTTLPDIGADENNFSVLPLRWLEIQGAFNYNKQAVIIFKVNENNVAYYTIEKSTNGHIFIPLTTINSKGNGENSYSVTDITASKGVCFYRVKQTDFNGAFTYSAIVKLSATNNNNMSVFPNPVSTMATVSGATIGATLQLVDVTGKLLQNIKVTNPTFRVDMSGYSKGLYLLQGNNQVIKVMKE